MPESTMLRYRIDEDLKEEAEAVFKKLNALRNKNHGSN